MSEEAKPARVRKTNGDYVAKSQQKSIAAGATRRTIMFDPEASKRLDELAAEWQMSPTAVINTLLKGQ